MPSKFRASFPKISSENKLCIAAVGKRLNFPRYTFSYFCPPVGLILSVLELFFDSVSTNWLVSCRVPFFGLVLCFLPFNLSHISTHNHCSKKKKKVDYLSFLLLSLVCSCGCMGFKSSTAFSSAWKKGGNRAKTVPSFPVMHMDRLRGNVP